MTDKEGWLVRMSKTRNDESAVSKTNDGGRVVACGDEGRARLCREVLALVDSEVSRGVAGLAEGGARRAIMEAERERGAARRLRDRVSLAEETAEMWHGRYRELWADLERQSAAARDAGMRLVRVAEVADRMSEDAMAGRSLDAQGLHDLAGELRRVAGVGEADHAG